MDYNIIVFGGAFIVAVIMLILICILPLQYTLLLIAATIVAFGIMLHNAPIIDEEDDEAED